jgi:murein DD-endopeptidase MepM/ murein hydrolase activator NlpD
MKKYLFILIISTLFGMFAYADIYKIEFDTTKQNNFIINNVTLSDSTSIASILLNTNPVFTKNWDNNHLFVYGSKKLVELPDTLCLKLLNNDEKFTLTYYGNVNSSFGQRWGRTHEGIDFALHMNDYVYAAFDGVVRFAKFTNNGYGNCIIIRHLNGLETLYGHLNNINVIENQFVKSGEIIGLGGSTGRSTGPHLHFETRINDYSFNPEKIIDIKNKKLFFDSFNFSKKELFSEQFYTKPIVLTAGKKSSSKPKTNTKSKNQKRLSIKK